MPALPTADRLRLPRGTAVLAAVGALGALVLSGCGGGLSADEVLERYACSQTAQAMRIANGTADVTGQRNPTPVEQEVAQLRVPALRPVAITAVDGGLLPRAR